MSKTQLRKDFPPSQNGIGKKGSDDIQLLHTDTLIKEVAIALDLYLILIVISLMLLLNFQLSCTGGEGLQCWSSRSSGN